MQKRQRQLNFRIRNANANQIAIWSKFTW